MLELKPAHTLSGKPELLIADGGGTLFDPGSVVPAYAFQAAFKEAGILVGLDTIMKYMGRAKLEHIKCLFAEPEVLEQFRELYDRDPNNTDFYQKYNLFKAKLYSSASKNEEIPGVKEAAYQLKRAGIPLVLTTGYNRKMVDEIRKVLPWLDDVLTTSFTSDDVSAGRPAPYMLFRAMEAAGVRDVGRVIKVGDTSVDVEASDNARMPGIIVLTGGISSLEKALEVNLELGREHVVADDLVSIVNYTLDGTLQLRMKEAVQSGTYLI